VEVSIKQKYFESFEQDYEPSESAVSYSLLSTIKNIDETLYNICCKLHNNYKSKNILSLTYDGSESIDDNKYCVLLNEWLNKKAYEYIIKGSNCENNKKLWEEYIGKLWLTLKDDTGSCFSCNRNKITYDCSISPNLKTVLSVGFALLGSFLITLFVLYKFSPLGYRINNFLIKKKNKIQNTVQERSYESLQRTFKNGNSLSKRKSISIGYRSIESQ
ncbi:PIR Superfamily Protein, partial [Plasmodium malariae]